MHEPRAAVMIMVEASWEDDKGSLRRIPARIENKSAGGACIRVHIPIAVGSKLRIQSHWEHFSGVARYCMSEGMDYLVGIERDLSMRQLPGRPAPAVAERSGDMQSADPVPEMHNLQMVPRLPESQH